MQGANSAAAHLVVIQKRLDLAAVWAHFVLVQRDVFGQAVRHGWPGVHIRRCCALALRVHGSRNQTIKKTPGLLTSEKCHLRSIYSGWDVRRRSTCEFDACTLLPPLQHWHTQRTGFGNRVRQGTHAIVCVTATYLLRVRVHGCRGCQSCGREDSAARESIATAAATASKPRSARIRTAKRYIIKLDTRRRAAHTTAERIIDNCLTQWLGWTWPAQSRPARDLTMATLQCCC